VAEQQDESQRRVRQYRQILVWPLQLMPIREGAQIQNHWELLEHAGADNPWSVRGHGFDAGAESLPEQEYAEFVTFLPYVQRMLYGEGKGRGASGSESPVRVFRRSDVSAVRMVFPGRAEEAREFGVARVELYFFYDLDVALLVVEIAAQDIDFAVAQEILYRFGRSYPTYWTPQGHGGHCLERVEWLDDSGRALACSDFERRDKYLSYANRYRSPCISAHWEYLLRPLVLHHSDQPGPIRYRLVEYHRMPLCAFLAFDEPGRLTRADFVRLAFIAPPGDPGTLPFAESQIGDFEDSFCIDRYWHGARAGASGTRLLCSGEAFVMVTSARAPSYIDGGPSLLEQFRRQYFLVFLMSHLHKAALCMLSDRLVHTLNQMDIDDAATIRRFKRDIRQIKEIFLRFSHRYWFPDLADQFLAKALYHACRTHLSTAALFADLREEIEDMSRYLDSDALRRQANTVLRLTVVTVFGLIGTITTGFLGMNLIAEPDAPLGAKLLYFVAVFVPTVAVTFYTIARSKRLSDFLDALSEERLDVRAKFRSLIDVWRPRS
jgi:hypothetical protein